MIAALLLSLACLAGDLAALEQKLKDPSEKQRREAVQALAQDASKAAWTLVIGALADPSPMVADEAQLQLGALADEALHKELAGKKGLASGDDLLQRRAAEAFGRMPGPVDGGALGRLLSDKDPEVRRMAAWSLERLARRKALEARTAKYVETTLAEALRRDKDPLARAAVLLAAGATQPLDAKEILGDKAPEVLCAGLQYWAGFAGEESLDALALMRFSSDLPVRCEVAAQLARMRTRRGIGLLVEMLQAEKNTRLSWTIAAELTGLTGVRNERNAAAWKSWLDALPKDWRPGPVQTGEKKEEPRGPETTTCAFVGLPVLSDRLAILVDMSGSIWEKRADGKTRKEVLEAELEKTLGAFGKDVRFNLVPYTKVPLPWEKKLVEASPANVKRALEHFRGLKESGKGNVWDALQLALADPEVDTLLLFSDGAPTGGQRWNLELMGELLAERNRFRHVVLDAVIVDAGKYVQGQWKRMCEASGGRMLAVEMK